MASRLKRLVARKKDDPHTDQTLYRDTHNLSSIAYDGASAGQEPQVGSHPIRGSSEHTSSNFEPELSTRRRWSKRFSQSSHTELHPQAPDVNTTAIPSQDYEDIPHSDALYESRASPLRSSPHSRGHDRQRGLSPADQRYSSSQTFQQPQPLASHVPRQPLDARQVNARANSDHEAFDSSHSHAPPDTQEIINRAQYNSEDVDRHITMAPAVTHEVVHRHIHHLREEEITREIHDHDVYHRMLPIVDVEVLPARHFLPAEGGGLVEIESEDVPGRGKNWIIAETASKIPSNQPVDLKPRQFSARAFRGREGDDRAFYAPEGHVVTEHTWVHPPTLETGARDTGQSWPLEMENLSLRDKPRERSRSAGQRSGHRKSIERKPVSRR